MARHFVRLKLRLLANRLRASSVIGMVGFVLIWVAAVLGGALGGVVVFGLGRFLEEPGLALVVAYTVLFAGWMVIPASFSALDETLDPRRFELLPLSSRQMITGLMVAGAVTPGGVATSIGLVIATVASFPDWSLAPVLTVAIVIELLMCLLVARLVTSLLSNLLASRRAREIVTLVFGLGFALIALLPALLDNAGDEGAPDIEVSLNSLESLAFLAWTPPGALGRSVELMGAGDVLGGLGLIAYGAGTTAVIGWAWARSMRRMLVTAPISGHRGRRRDEVDRTLALTPGWLRISSGPVLGMVGKELRYLVRDNRVRSQLLGSIIPVVVIVFLTGDTVRETVYSPFLAVGAAFIVVFAILANQFGMDGGSFWGYVVSPASLSEIIRGKNLGWGIVVLGPVVALAGGLAFWSGQFTYLAAAALASLGVLLVALAIGNVTSIYGAFPIPESNPFGNRGFSGNVFVAIILSMMASGALLLPLAALVALPVVFLDPMATTVGAVLGVGYGILVYRLLMRLTSRLLVERRQVLLDTIDGDSG